LINAVTADDVFAELNNLEDEYATYGNSWNALKDQSVLACNIGGDFGASVQAYKSSIKPTIAKFDALTYQSHTVANILTGIDGVAQAVSGQISADELLASAYGTAVAELNGDYGNTIQ
jgi:hypothetical protein